MIGSDADYDRIGLNKVDFMGQTGCERSYEAGLREPGDYEAQVGQGPITIHKQERLGQTDTGIAMMRGLIRRQIRSVLKGIAPAQLPLNAEGRISTYSGDFVIRVSHAGDNDQERVAEVGNEVGRALVETLPLSFVERQSEVTRKLRRLNS